jgi:hypothetical protein
MAVTPRQIADMLHNTICACRAHETGFRYRRLEEVCEMIIAQVEEDERKEASEQRQDRL